MKEQKKQALAKHVKQQVDSGQDPQVLKTELEGKGWSTDEITAVFTAAGIDKEQLQAAEAANEGSGESDTTDPFMNTQEDTQEAEKTPGNSGDNTSMAEPPHPSYAEDDEESSQGQPADQQVKDGQNGDGTTFGAGRARQNNSGLTAGMVGLIVGVLVVIGAGGVLAYTNFVSDSAANPPSVEEVYQAHTSVNSLQYDTSMDARVDLNVAELQTRDDFDRFKQVLPYIPNTGDIGEVPEQLQMRLSVGGLVDLAEQSSGGKTTIQLGFGGNELENILDVELRYVDEVGYVNAKKLPSVPMFPVQSFESQWFSFTASSTPDQFGSVNTSVGDTELTDESIIGILKASQSFGLVSVEGVTAEELADGDDAYKYSLRIHPKNYSAFAQEVEAIISRNQPELADKQEFKDAISELKQSAESASNAPDQIGPVEAWVAADSKRLRKVSFEKTYTKEDIKQMSASEDGGDGTAESDSTQGLNHTSDFGGNNTDMTGFDSTTLSFAVNLSNYNQQISVQEPADATPIREAMESMPFFGGMSDARTSSRDARRQTDLNQIRTGLALYMNEEGSYPQSLYEGPNSLAESNSMTRVPTDPSDDTQYAYTTNTSAGDFCLGTAMEDTSSLPADNSQQCVEDLKAAGAEDINYAIGN